MREVLFNCFGAVNVEENDNGEFVKLSDFEKLAEKCSRYIDSYEVAHLKYLALKEKIEDVENQRIELLNRCDELEKQLDYKRDLPHSPLEAFDFLVHDRYKSGASALEKRMFGDCEEIEELRYNIDELEQIAEHLLIYCKHNKGCE